MDTTNHASNRDQAVAIIERAVRRSSDALALTYELLGALDTLGMRHTATKHLAHVHGELAIVVSIAHEARQAHERQELRRLGGIEYRDD